MIFNSTTDRQTDRATTRGPIGPNNQTIVHNIETFGLMCSDLPRPEV